MQNVDDGCFGSAVDFGDKIIGAFIGDFERINVVAGAVDNERGAARGLDGNIQSWMHKLDGRSCQKPWRAARSFCKNDILYEPDDLVFLS